MWFGDETFWLNVVNAAFGIVTVAAVGVVVTSVVIEIARRMHGPHS